MKKSNAVRKHDEMEYEIVEWGSARDCEIWGLTPNDAEELRRALPDFPEATKKDLRKMYLACGVPENLIDADPALRLKK